MIILMAMILILKQMTHGDGRSLNSTHSIPHSMRSTTQRLRPVIVPGELFVGILKCERSCTKPFVSLVCHPGGENWSPRRVQTRRSIERSSWDWRKWSTYLRTLYFFGFPTIWFYARRLLHNVLGRKVF